MASSSHAPACGSQLPIESRRLLGGDDRDGLEQEVRPQTIERRVETLEKRVTKLEKLPAMVEGVTAQILQLRAEMGSEFSTMRREALATEKKLLHGMGRTYSHTMKEIIDRVDSVSGQISSFREEVLSGLAEIKDRLP